MTNSNSPAFAQPKNTLDRLIDGELISTLGGLTIREYYAGLAMQGLSNADVLASDIAKRAVLIADNLIVELNK